MTLPTAGSIAMSIKGVFMSEFNYEKSVKRLEEIVKALESGEFTLDKMMKLYEEGITISAQCNKALDEAEFKITELSLKGNYENE